MRLSGVHNSRGKELWLTGHPRKVKDLLVAVERLCLEKLNLKSHDHCLFGEPLVASMHLRWEAITLS